MHFSKRYRYRFGDIDDAGVAYYPSFFHYFHAFFEDWWSEALETPYPSVLHDEKFGLPVVRVECDFLRPVRYGDEPDFHLGILEMGKSSVKFAYWLSCGEKSETICRARITTVATDMDSFASMPVPEKWRARFEAFRISESQLPD